MKRILAATDFSRRSDLALERAADLARTTNARLDILHVLDSERPLALSETDRRMAAAYAEDIREKYGAPVRLDTGDPFASILEAAAELDADLIVLGMPRRSSLRDFFAGTTAERTIRNSPRQILLVKAGTRGFYRQPLLTLDFTPVSVRAAEVVKTLPWLAPESRLTALNVFNTPAIAVMARSSTTSDEINAYVREEQAKAEASLTAFLTRHGLTAAARAVRPSGASVARTICETASSLGADLIIAGTRARSGLSRMVLGSVAEEILRLSPVDVLAVPPA
jgi:nucleotide-binding universal stress UspA family protein